MNGLLEKRVQDGGHVEAEAGEEFFGSALLANIVAQHVQFNLALDTSRRLQHKDVLIAKTRREVIPGKTGIAPRLRRTDSSPPERQALLRYAGIPPDWISLRYQWAEAFGVRSRVV